MALKSDDPHIRPARRRWGSQGGNGDYYICILEKKDQFNDKGDLAYNQNVLSVVRVSTKEEAEPRSESEKQYMNYTRL